MLGVAAQARNPCLGFSHPGAGVAAGLRPHRWNRFADARLGQRCDGASHPEDLWSDGGPHEMRWVVGSDGAKRANP